ncbi:hypothetical protein BKA58DRAFT_461773 [Alternaria rosae]|uniref:uncharacterized protein n=1 Tax=Alternaria rosae TaxID=1187941 RepID=UPI001E8D00A1|nr:uncharacterized protein BKA58DRAFT_461773 [Alternaria rosae]KAH6865781.1 hypothetical protein BKA58DRAFT_461773 [Alternaria rosae]
MRSSINDAWNRVRGNDHRNPQDSQRQRITRSQSSNIYQQLQTALGRNQELERGKRNIEHTVSNLRENLRRHKDDIAKKEGRIVRNETAYRKLQAKNRQLQDECKEWEEESKHIDGMYNHIMAKVIKPYAVKQKLDSQSLTDESVKELLDSMLRQSSQVRPLRAELQRLRTRIQELQQDMLAKVDKVDATSDDQFAKEFRSLASSIKSFSRSLRFTTHVDITEVLGSVVLLNDVAPHHWNGRPRKKALTEAWIWSILICLVFKSPYAVFGDYCKALNEAWVQIYGAEHLLEWPLPSPYSESWRIKTVEQLLEQTSPDTIAHGEPDGLPVGLTASVVEVRLLAMSVICGHFESLSPGFKVSDIQLIVDKAFSLALHMSTQQSRFQVTYPAIGAEFHEAQMLSVDNDDDEDMGASVVAFVINPGLTKWGDAHGEHYDHCHNIVPTLVQLEPKDLGRNLDDRQKIVDAEPVIKQEPGVKQEPEWC